MRLHRWACEVIGTVQKGACALRFIEIKKPKRIHKRVNLPFLSNEAWALLGIGMVGGLIGSAIHTWILFPFLK